MRFLSGLIIFTILMISLACAESRPATPIETYKAYTKAIKEKDTTTMKLLLSQETIKMHEQEAKAQGVTLDEVVKRETLFTPGQKMVKFQNEKIDGDKATLEVENSFGSWETVPFVKEDGHWRIDKKGYANQMIQEIEQRQNDVFNQGRIQ